MMDKQDKARNLLNELLDLNVCLCDSCAENTTCPLRCENCNFCSYYFFDKSALIV